MSKEGAGTRKFFLSYSRSDQEVALRFATDLRNAGIAMWVDQLDIRPSEHWDRAIERAVRDCHGLVVMISPRSVASDNVADEISFAIEHGKSVLPVMIEQCSLPLRITRMQVVDATGNYERAVKQCLDALGDVRSSPPEREPAVQTPTGISDPAVIAAALAKLTPILGPIAAVLVEKAAARARSIDHLYQELAGKIESGPARDQFLKSAGASSQSAPSPVHAADQANRTKGSIPAGDVERLASLLTRHVGPIAGVIAKREATSAMSCEDLKQKLAAHILDERERREFLARA